jgi:aspartyl/asparaginyl beta-hydroxylase (cupin superfamily)
MCFEVPNAGFLPIEPCATTLAPFTRSWALLAAEAEALRRDQWIAHPDRHITERGWAIAPVRYFGTDHPDGRSTSPVLWDLVSRSPEIVGAGYYALEPGTELAAHRGNPVGIARFHLGLRVPDDCSITVNGAVRRWKPGEWLAFDDSQLHAAVNRSSEPRVVLVLDLEHPDVPVPRGARTIRRVSGAFYRTGASVPALQVLAGRMNWLSRSVQTMYRTASSIPSPRR